MTEGLPVSDAVSAGDDYSDLFRSCYPGLVRTAYLVVRDLDAAQDVAQEAFVRTLVHWRRVQRYERPDLWVRKVAVRLAVRAAKQQARKSREPVDADLVEQAHVLDLDLVRTLAQLPPAQRAAVVLHYLEDRPVAEVAHLMSCAESTAKVHLHRGRRRLAALLGEEAGA